MSNIYRKWDLEKKMFQTARPRSPPFCQTPVLMTSLCSLPVTRKMERSEKKKDTAR